MKKIFNFGLLTLTSVLFFSCASMGVASQGSSYFIGKSVKSLGSYFDSNIISLGASEGYDSVLECNNKEEHHIVSKTRTIYYKKAEKVSLMNFKCLECADGCYLKASYRGPHKYYSYNDAGKLEFHHENDNAAINKNIRQFNNYLANYNMYNKNQEKQLFEKNDIGASYYLYELKQDSSSHWRYDGTFKSEASTKAKLWKTSGYYDKYVPYTYRVWRVDLVEASRQETERHEYLYDSFTRRFYDESLYEISSSKVYDDIRSYQNRGFSYLLRETGLHIKAFIANGKVVDIIELE